MKGGMVNVREVRNEAVRSRVVNGAKRQVDEEDVGWCRDVVVRGRRGDTRENNNWKRNESQYQFCSQVKMS